MSTSTAFTHRGRVTHALALAVALFAMLLPTAASAEPIDVASLRNHVGICHTATDTCNFDDVGYGYHEVAQTVGGAEPGAAIEADGFTFTWPDVGSGENDNITLVEQLVPVEAGDATRLGLLGASHHGPVTFGLTLHYAGVDAQGQPTTVEVVESVQLSDWTLNGGGSDPVVGNTIAVEAPFRAFAPAVMPTTTYAFAVAVDFDPDLTLTAIEFPREKRVHLFDLVLA